jgi:hypothetical protein
MLTAHNSAIIKNDLQTRYKQMEEDLKSKIDEIHKALVGSDLHPEGLICKVEKMAKKVDYHDLLFKIGAGIIAVLTGLIAFWNDLKTLF